MGKTRSMTTSQHARTQRRNKLLLCVVTCLFAFYACAALYYSTLEPDALRLGAVGLCALLCAATLRIRHTLHRFGALCGLCACFAIWLYTDHPSNNREWAGEYAILADAIQDGRMVHVRNIRDFTYRTETDYTPHYYNADFNLDHLASIDLITSYWGETALPMCFCLSGLMMADILPYPLKRDARKNFPIPPLPVFSTITN